MSIGIGSSFREVRTHTIDASPRAGAATFQRPGRGRTQSLAVEAAVPRVVFAHDSVETPENPRGEPTACFGELTFNALVSS